jgi:hypothetical protein
MTLRIKNAGDPLRESNIVEVLTATKMKPEPGTTLRGFYRLLPRLVGAFDQGGIWGIGNRERRLGSTAACRQTALQT